MLLELSSVQRRRANIAAARAGIETPNPSRSDAESYHEHRRDQVSQKLTARAAEKGHLSYETSIYHRES
jgi:hypothetical protein